MYDGGVLWGDYERSEIIEILRGKEEDYYLDANILYLYNIDSVYKGDGVYVVLKRGKSWV